MSQDSQIPARKGGDPGVADALRPSLVACLLDAADLERRAEELRSADILEVRADRVGDLDAARLRDRFEGHLLYTLRSKGEGGEFDGDGAERRRRLAAAAVQYDLVDLELETDAADDVLLASVPAHQRVVSWHGQFGRPQSHEAIEDIVDRQFAIDAAHSKIVVAAETTDQALCAIEILVARLGTMPPGRGLTCFAMGAAGSWTRPLAARLGSALTFTALAEQAAAGQLSLDRLLRDYALDRALPRPDRLFGVVGWPVAHSLSPRLHNGAYLEGGVDGSMFLPFATESFEDFWEVVLSGRFEALGFELGGFAVTTPHKEAAACSAETQSDVVTAIGAGNTLTPRGADWRIDSTDPDGVVGPLRNRGLLRGGVRAAVLGAGGAGRAAVVGLRAEGAEVVLVNRTEPTGRKVAEMLGVPFETLDGFDPNRFDVIVNATALGHRAADRLPFDCERTQATVVDMVYRASGSTDLIETSRRKGLVVVDGREVLLHQALTQFERMTGSTMNGEQAAGRLGAPWVAPPTEETR